MTVARGDEPDIIANARLTGSERTDPFADEPVDVHLADGLVVDIAPAGALPRRGLVVDAEGGRVIPGLWDHHVHVVQWALAAEGRAGAARVRSLMVEGLPVRRSVVPLVEAEGRDDPDWRFMLEQIYPHARPAAEWTRATALAGDHLLAEVLREPTPLLA